jgi:Leucine-rich repeat (LRR) protein
MNPYLIEPYTIFQGKKKNKHWMEIADEEALFIRMMQQWEIYNQINAGCIFPPTTDPPYLTYSPSQQILDWYTGADYGGTGYYDVTLADFQALTNKNDVRTFSIYQTTYPITSISGLHHYPNLDTIEISEQNFTTIDVSQNLSLTRLYIYYNQLTSLDVSNNTLLIQLQCDHNQLTSLDVSNNTALVYLQCQNNQLTSLDVSNNTLLVSLKCENNQLTSLDVSNNTSLITLTCGTNNLTTVDVSNNTSLQTFFIDNNNLSSININNNTALTNFNCISNNLTSLNVSNNTSLQTLTCGDNNLTSLDISNNTVLKFLLANINQLDQTSVDNILINLDAFGLTNGWCYLNGGTNASPSVPGINAKNNLIAKGWIVSTN